MGICSKQFNSMILHWFRRWRYRFRLISTVRHFTKHVERGRCYSELIVTSPHPKITLLQSDCSHIEGLSHLQAAAQLKLAGPNQLPDLAAVSHWQTVRQILTEPMFVMLMIAGSLYLLLGDPWEAALLLGFVMMVMLLSITQQQRTEHTLSALRRLSAPRALVIREQQLQRIAAADVVCGDVLQLHEGDRVAADAILLEGVLTLNESLLTGEACAIVKNATAATVSERQLFASTLVLNGSALAQVTATGSQTAIGKIQHDYLAAEQPISPLQRKAQHFIRWLGALALSLALCQILLAWLWNGQDFMPSVLAGIALAMAILPEEIPVILTVFFALGAWRLAQQQLLTRHIAAVEALGAVTVLAVDKTGTLTQNTMQVAAIYSAETAETSVWMPQDHRWQNHSNDDDNYAERDGNTKSTATNPALMSVEQTTNVHLASAKTSSASEHNPTAPEQFDTELAKTKQVASATCITPKCLIPPRKNTSSLDLDVYAITTTHSSPPLSAQHLVRTALAASAPLTVDAMELALQHCADTFALSRPTNAALKQYPVTADCLATTWVYQAENDAIDHACSHVALTTAKPHSSPIVDIQQAPSEPLTCTVMTKGAPETIATLCHLDEAQTLALTKQVAQMAAQGWRVLAVARGTVSAISGTESLTAQVELAEQAKDLPWSTVVWPQQQREFLRGKPVMNMADVHNVQSKIATNNESETTPPTGQAESWLHYMGLVAFADPPRPDVAAALVQCQQAGIRVLMLTGDHPATARAIARQIGVLRSEPVLMGAELAEMTDHTLIQRLTHCDIAARLQPADKTRIVHALQQQGHVVVMTGDGVNDAPALRAADIGIAMGRRGSDVAREAAAMVLLDDSFASIVHAIAQGRRIYRNINDACRFTFAVHIPIIGLALFPLLMQWPAVLKPLHIVVLELIINPACTLFFERQATLHTLMQQPPRRSSASPFAWTNLAPALLQGFGVTLLLLLNYAVMLYLEWSLARLQGWLLILLISSALGLIWVNLTQPWPVAMITKTISDATTSDTAMAFVNRGKAKWLWLLLACGWCAGSAMLGILPLGIGFLLMAIWLGWMRLVLSRR